MIRYDLIFHRGNLSRTARKYSQEVQPGSTARKYSQEVQPGSTARKYSQEVQPGSTAKIGRIKQK